MRDHGGFEHNRHGVRIIDSLEHPYPQFRGLNLTYEIRECMAKHATHFDRPQIEGFEAGQPPLEGQVVELADSIAYDSHDLDDALAMGIVTATDLANLAIFRQAASDFARTLADLTDDQRIRRIARLLIDLMASDAIAASERAIQEAGVRTASDVRAAPRRLIGLAEGLAPKVRELETFLMGRVYRHYRVARMMTKARRFITLIFEAYRNNPDQLPPKYRAQADAEGLDQAICDYIAGMTDRYAQDEYQRLYEPFERV
jgi:dGTPase